jgi:hypothetical protein
VKLALVVCVTLVSVGFLELAVRIVGQTDADGNFRVGHRQALPLRMPVRKVEDVVRQYRQSSLTLFAYDPKLGWKPRPGARNELYAYDAAGIRARTPDDPQIQERPGALRVAVFGDSFAHGSEVTFDESWGAQVERTLDRPDRPVDVLNFGVPGYGMDQALLRWEEEGVPLRPDVVVFGLQLENAGRNLNLLRVLYDGADLPFAKPRFVESAAGLELVNVPVPPPEQVPGILQTLDEWPLVRHERYYEADWHAERVWRRSRLLGMVEAAVAGAERAQPTGQLPDEPRRLALKIIERFARSVEATGARFVVVHFPRRVDLEQARAAGGQLPNLDFLEAVARIAPVVRVDATLLERAGGGDMGPLFRPGGHYSPEGYGLLAASVADRLKADLATASRALDGGQAAATNIRSGGHVSSGGTN